MVEMDTREKILDLPELAGRTRDGLWTAMLGVFDPFTPKVAQAIRERTKPGWELLVVVAPGEGTLLSAEARATLIAALRDVHAVLICEPIEARAVLRSLGIEIFEDVEADRERSRAFVEFVLSRQASADAAKGSG